MQPERIFSVGCLGDKDTHAQLRTHTHGHTLQVTRCQLLPPKFLEPLTPGPLELHPPQCKTPRLEVQHIQVPGTGDGA